MRGSAIDSGASPMWLVVVAVVSAAAVLAPWTADAAQVQGQGFDTLFPPLTGIPGPHLKTPTDTRMVSPEGPREAQLACVSAGPVKRALICDIITWDVCGNPDGARGNETVWEVLVVHALSGQASRLVSPVIYLRTGVARFHFTAIRSGVHRVEVRRRPTLVAHLAPLDTPPLMRQLVVVHDLLGKCTQEAMRAVTPQLRRVMWAQASANNEAPVIPGMDQGRRVSTTVDVDRIGAVAPDAALAQEVSRRAALQPTVHDPIGPYYSKDESFHYCDFVKKTG